jgi:dephospho-CoA kinase
MVVGITGSIATGKSLVTNHLIEKGYQVIDSDKLTHQVLKEPEVIKEIIDAFGKELLIDNEINRRALGNIIFNNSSKRETLEKIIHPRVIKKINDFTMDKSKLAFVDIPLLFEKNLEYLVDKIIVVYVSKEVQLSRLMNRDNIDIEYAIKKICSQMDILEKTKHADYIVNNEGNIIETYKQIHEILRRIKNEI